ncbi:nuclear transcription factor Y subunit beta [Drosophila tropicalis]|uniref:nuclear transcription factor Y subunit beta n=1 Tax=Drosophila tropicalis TaxID=46794 RepID=UPI0035ABA95F
MLMPLYHKNLESQNDTLASPSASGSGLRFQSQPVEDIRNIRRGNGSKSSSTVAAHTKMRLLSKVEQNMRQNQQGHHQRQQHHQNVNRLIHTAATGNGVVVDVDVDDGLLTPMRNKPQPYSSTSNGGGAAATAAAAAAAAVAASKGETRAERNLWSRAEMLEMLSIMQNINALEQLKDRNIKSEHVFRQIEQIMRSKNYVKKSSIQIWTKWKFLKSTYNTTTRHGTGIPKVVPEEVYRVLCRMLGNSSDGGSIGGGSGAGGSNSNISECDNSMDSSKTLGDDSKEDMLGVEHPIFGYRLGAIKPEPIDTGYDDVLKVPDSISEQDTRETLDFEPSVEITHSDHSEMANHMPFVVSVKHEPEMDLGMDGTNTPPPTAPASPSPPPGAHGGDSHDDDMYTPMPPLRVASFAKGSDYGLRRNSQPANMHGADRQTPALSKGKQNRSLPLQSTSNINFVHPTSKLMLPRKIPVRLPRDISVQPAGMRLKPVPIRDTGYSLRPERNIPDLEQSISPPHSPTQATHNQQLLLSRGQQPPRYSLPPYAASTSRQAQLMSQQHQQRKRRTNPDNSPVPVKLQRSSTHYETTSRTARGNLHDEEQKLTNEEPQSNRIQQHQQQLDEVFSNELSQLADAMREAQKEMLEDFFKQQREFARREHEFQMRQDTLIMQALRRQTDTLLRTANELLGMSSNTNETRKFKKNNRSGSSDKTKTTEVPETELLEPDLVIEKGHNSTETIDDEEELDEVTQLDDGDEAHGSNESDMSTLAMSASAMSEYDGINADV